VICTDQIVHELYRPGQPLPNEIARILGDRMLTSDGGVNRAALAKTVFSDATALQRLNALVHPVVREAWNKRAALSLEKALRTMVVIPLAYETQATGEFQQTWVVACSHSEQRNRLRQRGMDDAQIEQRFAAQWPLQKKLDLADVVVWNNGPWHLTEQQLEQVLCMEEPDRR
jgi:dephospho-CoA kinase